MIYIAFTLGIFGSLHCLGMCGPLAFALLPGVEKGGIHNTLRALSYNIGRIISYTILGVFTGLLSSAVHLTGIQRPLTIVVGILMIILFLVSMDFEKLILKSSNYSAFLKRYQNLINKAFHQLQKTHAIFLGMVNGLVPCGLVYLALAGSLTADGLGGSILFMTFFGLGTLPAMFLLLAGTSLISLRKRLQFRKVFAYLQLFVGVFMLYRAFAVELPDNLELYWSMGKLMCH